MKYEISEEVIKRTTRCPFKIACLENGWQICKGKRNLENSGLILQERKCPHACDYSYSFGITTLVCGCPVRIEMFRKYQV